LTFSVGDIRGLARRGAEADIVFGGCLVVTVGLLKNKKSGTLRIRYPGRRTEEGYSESVVILDPGLKASVESAVYRKWKRLLSERGELASRYVE
jgi:hypothetical protein